MRRNFFYTAVLALTGLSLILLPATASAKTRQFHKRFNTVFSTVLDGKKIFKKKDTVKFINNVLLGTSAKLNVRKLNANGRITNTRTSEGTGLPVTIEDDLTLTGLLNLDGYTCNSGEVFGWNGSAWGCVVDDVAVTLDDASVLTGGNGITVSDAGEIAMDLVGGTGIAITDNIISTDLQAGTGVDVTDDTISRAGIAHTIQIPLADWLVTTEAPTVALLSSSTTPTLKFAANEFSGYPYIEWSPTSDSLGDSITTQVTLPANYVNGTDLILHATMRDTTGAFLSTSDELQLSWHPLSIDTGHDSDLTDTTVTIGVLPDANDGNVKDYTLTISADDLNGIAVGDTLSLELSFNAINEKWNLINTAVEYTGY